MPTPRTRRLVALLAAIAPSALPVTLVAQPRPERPNVVLIITDDMGWADLGSYGAPDVKTPNIDRLARAGIRFTDFYANAVLCSPTRAGLITGRYQQRYGVEMALSAPGEVAGERGLTASPTSLPRLLKNAGYATALVGKWHLGYTPETSPGAHGFDWFWGLKSGYHDYWQHTDSRGNLDLWENEAPARDSGYTTDLITAKAIGWIDRHARESFFIDVAYNAPHWPYQRPDVPSVARDHARSLGPADSATSTRADYVAMVERIDRGVGEIVAALDRQGLTRNTLVIFTNDNGGEWLSNNAPLFNRKWTVWEGGIRVPAIMRWPGRIPPGRVTAQVGITMDLTATVLAATGAGVPAEARLEGVNLLPQAEGRAPVSERTLFWRTNVGDRTMKAVRQGDYKLVVDANRLLLFNVRTDPAERIDLVQREAPRIRTLRKLIAAWESDVDAEARTRP